MQYWKNCFSADVECTSCGSVSGTGAIVILNFFKELAPSLILSISCNVC